MKERKHNTGYRVHLGRLNAIDNKDASFIKTHKYKLDISQSNQQELWEKFSELGYVTDSFEKGSLMWLLVRLWGLGFLFVPKPDAKIPLMEEMEYIQPVIKKAIAKITNKKKRNSIIDKNASKLEIFLKERAGRKNNAEDELNNIRYTLNGIFDPLFTVKTDKTDSIAAITKINKNIKYENGKVTCATCLTEKEITQIQKTVKKGSEKEVITKLLEQHNIAVISQIFNELTKLRNQKEKIFSHKEKKLNSADKLRVFDKYFFNKEESCFTELFGKDATKDDKDNKVTGTFVLQDLSLEELRTIEKYDKNDDEKIVYWVIFDRIFSFATKLNISLDDVCKNYLMTDGIGNFLHKVIHHFYDSPEKVKEIIQSSFNGMQVTYNPFFGTKGKNKLDYIAQKVFEYIQEVKKVEMIDFISVNYGSYRKNLGGRFQGWFTNFLNRLVAYKDALLKDCNTMRFAEKWYGVKIENDHYVFYQADYQPERKDLHMFAKHNRFKDKAVTVKNWKDELEKVDFDKTTDIFIYKELTDKLDKSSKNNNFKIIEKILENSDTRIFTSYLLTNPTEEFEKLKSIHEVLLEQLLREDYGPDFIQNIEQYNNSLSAINEVLISYNNSGKEIQYTDKDGNEITITKIRGKDQKPQSLEYWIDEALLKKKSEKKGEKTNEQEEELEQHKIYLNGHYVLKALPRFPRFLGQAKKGAEQDLQHAWEELFVAAMEGHSFVHHILQNKNAAKKNNEAITTKWFDYNKKEDDNHLTHGTLRQRLQSLLKIARDCHPQVRKDIIVFVQQFTTEPALLENLIPHSKNKKDNRNRPEKSQPDTKKEKKHSFYCSEYQRRQDVTPLPLLPNPPTYNEFVKKVETELFKRWDFSSGKMTKDVFKNYFDLSEPGGTGVYSASRVEILKFYWGLKLLNIEEELTGIKIDRFKKLKESKAGRFLEPTMRRETIQRLVQSGYGAKLRGSMALLSRKEYSERHVIQIINGGQSWLRYVPFEFGEASIFKDLEDAKKKQLYKQMRKRKNTAVSSIADAEQLKKRYKVICDKDGTCIIACIDFDGEKPDFKPNLPVIKVIDKNDKKTEKIINSYKEVSLKQLNTEHRAHVESLMAKIKIKQVRKEDFNEEQKRILSKDKELKELLSKSDYTNKEIAQCMWTKLKNKQLSDKTKAEYLTILAVIPHRWEMVLATYNDVAIGVKKIEEGVEGCLYDSAETNGSPFKIKITTGYHGFLFPVETKGHQLQFFEKFLSGAGKDFKTIHETIGGSTVILEKDRVIQWRNGKADIQDKTDRQGKPVYRMFWTIPWSFEKLPAGGKTKDKNAFNIEEAENYLGIDLGEYGIGWAVLPKNGTGKDFIASGFQMFPILKKLRDEADDWKLKQASGIFTRPTTRLARIRENAIGQIRNYIHSLCLEYEAQPVYETEVDAFESGGQKIKKLYKSLKTSDVNAGNDADKQVQKNSWGIQKIVGFEIGASMTSQTCRACGRSATGTIDEYRFDKDGKEQNKNITVKNGTITIGRHTINCTLNDGESKSKARKSLNNGEYESKYIRKVVKDAQRQSSNSGKGSQDEFVCQFADCNNKCNADEQAAKNIALKKYIRDRFINANGGNTKYKKSKEFEKYKTDGGELSAKKLFLDKSPLYE